MANTWSDWKKHLTKNEYYLIQAWIGGGHVRVFRGFNPIIWIEIKGRLYPRQALIPTRYHRLMSALLKLVKTNPNISQLPVELWTPELVSRVLEGQL